MSCWRYLRLCLSGSNYRYCPALEFEELFESFVDALLALLFALLFALLLERTADRLDELFRQLIANFIAVAYGVFVSQGIFVVRTAEGTI